MDWVEGETLGTLQKAAKPLGGIRVANGAMTIGDKFNMDNNVYKVSQKPDSYLAPAIVAGMK